MSGFFFVAVFARLLGVIHAVGLFSFTGLGICSIAIFQKQKIKIGGFQNSLHLRVSVFKRMLKEKTPFDEEHIRRLVYFMGAKAAFEVIYFHTLKERERVKEKVFGKGK